MSISFAEAMIGSDLEPASFVIDGEERYALKGVYNVLLGGVVGKAEYCHLDPAYRAQALAAYTCAAVSERDPAEAIEFLVKSGVDLPIDFIADMTDTWEFLEEYIVLHPPDVISRTEVEERSEFEI